MNFQTARQLKGQKDAKGYAIKQDIFLTFTEIGGTTFTTNQKQTCKCKATDDLGESHTVNFYGKIMPASNMLGRRVVASVAAVDGDYGEIWQAFLKSGNVSQPPQNPQQAALPPRQATNAPQVQSYASFDKSSTNPNWGTNSSDNKNTSFALSYAKDLVIAHEVELPAIKDLAVDFKYFLDNGKWKPETHSITEEPDDLPEGFGEEQPKTRQAGEDEPDF